jgi:hypothetical protein
MHFKICSQKDLLISGITQEARCVDAERLEKVYGKPLTSSIKLKGNRKECGCYASRDIGEYDTCPHGCVYCYAVQYRDLALERYKAHDPTNEFLFLYNDAVPAREMQQIIPAPKGHNTTGSLSSSSAPKTDSFQAEQQRLFEIEP